MHKVTKDMILGYRLQRLHFSHEWKMIMSWRWSVAESHLLWFCHCFHNTVNHMAGNHVPALQINSLSMLVDHRYFHAPSTRLYVQPYKTLITDKLWECHVLRQLIRISLQFYRRWTPAKCITMPVHQLQTSKCLHFTGLLSAVQLDNMQQWLLVTPERIRNCLILGWTTLGGY